MTYSIVAQGVNGTASVVGDLLHYVPAGGASGVDTFTYKAADSQLADSKTATISVSIVAVTQSISLYSGWNLISLNVQPTDAAVAAVLADISNQYTLVYAWDPQTGWLIYDPGLPENFNTLKTLDERMGYWIKMKTDQTLVVGGNSPANTDINLGIGWNLVGYPSAASRVLPGVLTEHGLLETDFTLVYAYHASDPIADRWKLFDPSLPIQFDTLTALTSGWGYWIKAIEARTWNVP